MRRSLSLTPRRLAIAVGLLLALAAAVLLALPAQLPSARALKQAEDHWAMPQPISVGADEALSVINQRRLWGSAPGGPGAAGKPAAEEKPLTPPDWRIVGVFVEGQQRGVLVATEGQPLPATLRIGDALPGGAKIVDIGNERICLLLNGRRVSLSTYRQ